MTHEKLSLGEVCDFVGGSQPPKSTFSSASLDNYVRLIQIRDYKSNNFLTYIPKDSARKFCNSKDVMIGRYGPPIFQILRGLTGAYNVALMKAVPKGNITNDYLYYFLRQEHLFNYIDGLSPRTGGQTGVDVTMLKEYPIPLPNIKYQIKVASVLSQLDKKIELNNKINAELEAMSKLIYDYWFVQFDFPDANGNPYKSSGGKMVYNETLKREIPDGWSNGTLSDLGEIVGGSTPSTKNTANFTENGMPWITPKDLSKNVGNKFISCGGQDVTGEGIKSASLKIYPKSTVLMSSRAPIGYMAIASRELTTNQGFKSFIPSKGFASNFIFYAVKNSMKTIIQYSSGSTFKEVSGTVLKTVKISVPKAEISGVYSNKIKSIFERQNLLEEENKKLSELRDWLLPMLMNGQVTVKDY